MCNATLEPPKRDECPKYIIQLLDEYSAGSPCNLQTDDFLKLGSQACTQLSAVEFLSFKVFNCQHRSAIQLKNILTKLLNYMRKVKAEKVRQW